MAAKNLNLPSKMVADRVKACRAVLWALETHGQRLVQVLGGLFASFVVDGLVLPFEALLELFKKALTERREQMVAADRVFRDRRAVEAKARRNRDQAMGQLSAVVLLVRGAYTSVYGAEEITDVGFAGRTPQLPGELLEQAAHLTVRLNDPALELPEPRLEDVPIEMASLSQSLAPRVELLEQAVEDLVREERLTEAARILKNEALEAFNDSFLWIARTVESLFRLAGLDQEADKVRPSNRRRGLTTAEPEDAEPEEPDAAGDGSQDTAPESPGEPGEAEPGDAEPETGDGSPDAEETAPLASSPSETAPSVPTPSA